MNTLTTLQQQALVAASALKLIDPQYFHHHAKQQVIFGNFNQFGFKTHQKDKKHLGHQLILEAIARINGFNTYKSLLDKPPTELLEDTLLLALKSLNPYPLSVYQTLIWDYLMADLVKQIQKGYHPQTFNFKRHDQTAYIGTLYPWYMNTIRIEPHTKKNPPTLFKIKKETNTSLFQDYAIIATSIFLTAIKTKITGYLKDHSVCDDPDQYLHFGNNIAYLKTDPIPLKDFLIQQKWEQEDFLEFREGLAEAFYELFCGSKLLITGSVRNPLENTVVLKLSRSQHNALLKYEPEGLEIEKRRLENYQKAALDLISQPDIGEDNQLYEHPEYKNCYNTQFIYSTELTYQIANWAQNQSTAKNPLLGTKAFWINISPSFILETPFNELFTYRKELSVDEYKALIQRHILDKIYPVGSNDIKCKKYYFRLNSDPRSDAIAFRYVHFTPEYITIKAESDLPKELALLAVHAELSKINPGTNKQKGIHNKHIAFIFGDMNHCPFENPEQFTGLHITNIQQMQKAPPAALNPYEVEFDPRQIIEKIESIKLEELETDYESKEYSLILRLTLIDTLHKGDYTFEDSASEVMVEASLTNSSEHEYTAFKIESAEMRAERLDITQTEAQKQINKELRVEQKFLDNFCIRTHLNGFCIIEEDLDTQG